ncbi:hypothetical protein [Flavobacterium silvaticum]|uniref:Uncharacterized protein n=1 Tax=Flavobacterium silvaticum TaxID=1852020 RepID=A0A972FQA4_9FLAO|nr:hypothetical protein [Flavobacterium silvaticum]NMH26483.1 hypothetical protein [Flavobacterium silvaticum]
MIQLLSIKPAEIKNGQEISLESQLIMESLNEISNRINKLESKNQFVVSNTIEPYTKTYKLNNDTVVLGEDIYAEHEHVGRLVDFHPDAVFLEKDNKIIKIGKSDKKYKLLYSLPF